ncbi:HNH endonuclease [Herbiconiux sp. VKM Ac-1786]|uniref:HNH endonuclease n=1 Tax=Herbiconiux sp. VKM Ac-1786 TaxID=2783824 RepID=UPI00351C56D6
MESKLAINWVWDELVVLTDVLERRGWREIRSTSEDALELSGLLGRGLLHPTVALPDNFRSVNSIQLKSANIRTTRPSYLGRKTNNNVLDKRVGDAFDRDLIRMRSEAAVIRVFLEAGDYVEQDPLDVDRAADEGKVLRTLSVRRERDPKLRQRKIDAAPGGVISCEVCGFSFSARYGNRGKGYIEVHHTVPLHVSGPRRNSLDDLALLCANCHRMIHRGGWITVDELRVLVTKALS